MASRVLRWFRPRNQKSDKEATTMKTVSKKEARSKRQTALVAMTEEELAFETRMAAIQMLIPVALERMNEDLQKEHAALVGRRYGRGTPLGPWGTNAGSVY